jgi:dihydroorotate dehydrogenase
MAALDDLIRVAHETQLTGIIATNTTLSRDGLAQDPGIEGGLSGLPLKARSNQFLAHIFGSCDRNLVLMGVGGIFTGDDVYEKIRLGAHLCQIYTGWIYAGPHMVPHALQRVVQLMERDGVRTLAEARGASYPRRS